MLELIDHGTAKGHLSRYLASDDKDSVLRALTYSEDKCPSGRKPKGSQENYSYPNQSLLRLLELAFILQTIRMPTANIQIE